MNELMITKRIDMKRLMMAVAMTAMMTSQCYAADLKTESRVSGAVVTVGDVFDGVTAGADHVLAPAPNFGKTLKLNAHDLTRIATAFKLDWQPKSDMDTLVISRAAAEVDNYAIDAALQQSLADKMEGRKFDMQLTERSVSMFLPDNLTASVDADIIDFDPAKGDFRAKLSSPSREHAVTTKEVTGKVYALVEVPVLKAPLAAGDIIASSDLEYVDVRAVDASSSVIFSADKLVGMSPRRGLQAGRQIATADVITPVMVKKGQLITMILKNKIISLSAQGKALGDGAEGEVVRVLNTTSNQVIEGIVTGPQTVAIRAMSANM